MSSYQDEHNIQNSNENTQQQSQQSQQGQQGQQRQSLPANETMRNLEQFLAGSADNRQALQQLMEQALAQYVSTNTGGLGMPDLRIIQDMNAILFNSNATERAVDDEFLDTLERVPVKKMAKDKCCPICTVEFHEQDYPLIVRLPCDAKHCFDLDCVGPWLKINKTCPLCRSDVTEKKKIEIPPDSEEEEEGWDMYG
ncbi:unnamed protein product [Ambrosiozyma monospora]|uniref:Unnamed protein product n=1 Tax=Ambrosiozyma monospora TaxID=43982 RepID=A0A9W6T0K4_AMBMO|nr:unnamed protein product [Ambrosiozyma monospora]